MATFLVWSGGNNSSGTEASGWANAYTAFASAVTAATGDGDIIKVHKTHQDEVGADTIYTFANNVRVICVDKDSSDALSTMGTAGWIGNSTTNRSITIAGAYNLYFYGVTIRVSGSTNDSIFLNGTDAGHYEYESCYYWLANTSTAARIFANSNAASLETFTKHTNCTFRLSATAQSIGVGHKCEFVGCALSSAGSIPTTLFIFPVAGYAYLIASGCDFSIVTGTLVGDYTGAPSLFMFDNCKLGSGVTVLTAQTRLNKTSAEVFIYNCASGDTHYNFGHYNAFGETVAITSPYANDGALYDGTNHVTWAITTSAYCTYYTPYVSPWIEKYHSGTSAIAPYLEILRNNSTTAFNNDEVWAECAVQNNTGFVTSSFVNDRMAVLGTPAAQDNGVGLSGWTGEGGTAWSGKLVMPSVTPAEIGMLRMRVYVGKASDTVHVDPKIRT